MPDPWNRLTTETQIAYDAFSAYRDLGPNRTLASAFRARHGRTTGDAPRTWRAWSKKNNWRERALAFDARVASVRLADEPNHAERERLQAEDFASAVRQNKHLNVESRILDALVDRFVAMVAHPITRTRKKVSKDGKTIIYITNPAGWSQRTMVQLAREINQMGRLLHKLPAKVDEKESTPQDFAALFYDSDQTLAKDLPDGSTPPIPDDVLAKPNIGDAAKRGSDPAAGLAQPGIVRPPR